MAAHYWRGFLACQLLCWTLLGSWLTPSIRPVWDHLDHSLFFALNSSLAPRSWWGELWALLSFRAMDLLPLFMLAPFVLIPDLLVTRAERLKTCAHLFLLLVIMLLFRLITRQVIEMESIHFDRSSPSRTLQNVVLLSQLYPEFGGKDGSNWSFPGDHASVLMIVAAFLLTLKINRWSPFIIALAALFMLPRLFAGAHWFTDVVIGGTLIASQTIALGIYTPWPGRWAEQLAQFASRWVPERWR